ncbi:helix-turn-helix transcriptional regulator [Streptomyces abikoensis]
MENGDRHLKGVRPSENELGQLLVSWRERLDPRRIPGIDTQRRRLRSGLTQQEVATLTGVSVTWYRKLEKGEPADFSDAFLQRLTMTLRLDETERGVLFQLAVGRTPEPTRLAVDTAVDESMQALLDTQLPNPAYVTNLWWDIVAHNDQQADWFPWIPYERNSMRWAFLYPEAREQLVNWRDDWANPFLAQIRVAIAHNPKSKELAQLRDDILSGNAEAAELWKANRTQVHPDGDIRRLRLPYHQREEVPVKIMALAPLRNTQLRFIVLMRNWTPRRP